MGMWSVSESVNDNVLETDMFYIPRQSCVGGSRQALRVPGQGQQ